MLKNGNVMNSVLSKGQKTFEEEKKISFPLTRRPYRKSSLGKMLGNIRTPVLHLISM